MSTKDLKTEKPCNIDIVSGSTCPHCNGTGKMQQDYYDDNDMSKMTTIDEVCLKSDGSGIYE